jgi:hypothetical protein
MVAGSRSDAHRPREPARRSPPKRARLRVATAGVLALAALAGTTPARATSPPPLCETATAGQLSIQAGVRCACRFFPASALAATPAGHRWDCGILRARLDPAPVDLNPYLYPLPEALSIEGAIIGDPRSRPFDWTAPPRP